MRESMGLYRGLGEDVRVWYHGSLWTNLTIPERPVCLITEWKMVEGVNTAMEYRVDPATVGQFTGLKDVAMRNVFEGDICVIESDGVETIVWNDEYSRFDTEQKDGLELGWHVEIIGNIHDNPSLMEAGQ